MKKIARNMLMSFDTCERLEKEIGDDVWEITWDSKSINDQELATSIWVKNKRISRLAYPEWFDAIKMKATKTSTSQTLTGKDLYKMIQATCGMEDFFNLIREDDIEFNLIREQEQREIEMGDDQRPGHYELYGPDPLTPQGKSKSNIKISKAQWLKIGQIAGWEIPTDSKPTDSKPLPKEKQAPSWIHEIINPPSRGKMHRCKFCWTEVDKTDNGFKPFSQPYPHSDNCPYKESF